DEVVVITGLTPGVDPHDVGMVDRRQQAGVVAQGSKFLFAVSEWEARTERFEGHESSAHRQLFGQPDLAEAPYPQQPENAELARKRIGSGQIFVFASRQTVAVKDFADQAMVSGEARPVSLRPRAIPPAKAVKQLQNQ